MNRFGARPRLRLALPALAVAATASLATTTDASRVQASTLPQLGLTPQLSLLRRAYVDPELLAQANANPLKTFRVIVRGTCGTSAVERVIALGRGLIRRRLGIVDAVAADVTGLLLLQLSVLPDVTSITLDGRVVGSYAPQNPNLWQSVVGVDKLWGVADGVTPPLVAPATPAIAVIDSGVQLGRRTSAAGSSPRSTSRRAPPARAATTPGTGRWWPASPQEPR